MGVDLGDVAVKRKTRLDAFNGQVLAIDAYNTLYQFLSIIRQPDGTPLMDNQGNVTSHLAGLMYRTANLLEAGIRPVFVFDGKPHELKAATLAERRERKRVAEEGRQEALAAGDLDRAKSLAAQTARLTRPMVHKAKDLLDALGLPWMDAPAEGEAEASHLAARGVVDAAVSQDYDALLFGAPRLIRNVTVTGRRKLPGRNAWVDVQPEVIDLAETLEDLAVTREELVDVAILVGTDYHPGIKGVGPKRGLQLIKKHGGLDAALDHLGEEMPDADVIRGIFLQPDVVDAGPFTWGTPDEDAVLRLLVEEHGFGEDRVKGALTRFEALAEMKKQQSLDAFF